MREDRDGPSSLAVSRRSFARARARVYLRLTIFPLLIITRFFSHFRACIPTLSLSRPREETFIGFSKSRNTTTGADASLIARVLNQGFVRAELRAIDEPTVSRKYSWTLRNAGGHQASLVDIALAHSAAQLRPPTVVARTMRLGGRVVLPFDASSHMETRV